MAITGESLETLTSTGGEDSIGNEAICEFHEAESSNSKSDFKSDIEEHNFDAKQIAIIHIKGEDGELQVINPYECLEGITAATLEDLEELYVKHSNTRGFCVRRSTTRRTKNNELVGKYLVCHCEGKNTSKAQTPDAQNNSRKRKEFYVTRTGCKAKIYIKKVGEWYKVQQHVVSHNHNLTRPEWQYLHRSERKIGAEKGKAIITMEEAGLKPSDSYRYMVKEGGGVKEVGHSYRDHINFVCRLRMNDTEGGDAQRMIDMLSEQSMKEDNFFFRVKYDSEFRVTAIFWRDSMMAEDFRVYGDLLVLDTTYRTNKYNLICGPFTGLNNHRQNVMFGCAFIIDETTETFTWLLDTFKKSMENKEPTTIFTDQDQALSNAIEMVYPNTRHRLCIWHLKQNAMSHYGNLRSDSEFCKAFDRCLMFCRNEEVFEQEWQNLISKFNLQEHAWFKILYTLKEKWCTALNKDYFSARMLSSQRSESTNAAISYNTSKSTTLVKFYKFFKATVTQWRENEVNKEFNCSKAKPKEEEDGPELLQHAARVYTHTIFKDVKVQWDLGMASNAYFTMVDGPSTVYQIRHQKSSSKKGESVLYTPPTADKQAEVICSCRHFEEVGILCGHCLRVLHLNNEVRIPDAYVSLRWSKMAKVEIRNNEAKQTAGKQVSQLRDKVPWRIEMTRKFHNLVMKSEGDIEARRLLEESFERDSAAINTLTSLLEGPTSSENSSKTQPGSPSEPPLLNPLYTTTKGRSKRAKSGIERKTANGSEFGSKTPKPRLF